ncbi:MFS transporter small subunit [Nocardioides rubriscoriae]
MTARLLVAWTLVGVPVAYGLVETIRKASALFG